MASRFSVVEAMPLVLVFHSNSVAQTLSSKSALRFVSERDIARPPLERC